MWFNHEYFDVSQDILQFSNDISPFSCLRIRRVLCASPNFHKLLVWPALFLKDYVIDPGVTSPIEDRCLRENRDNRENNCLIENFSISAKWQNSEDCWICQKFQLLIWVQMGLSLQVVMSTSPLNHVLSPGDSENKANQWEGKENWIIRIFLWWINWRPCVK